ncbi:MAG: GAF domain-containing protein [Ktedonobacteraceae bacterium]|nr:GAF domain-containing protein [Ktedonobacteraceae bacterium]MBO0794005.1 GAF domain-containing protein [Ktedonobacteraceae bacterium]
MESSVQSETSIADGAPRSTSERKAERLAILASLRQEMEYLNTIGKRFVAAFDRFQVHRALLETLQDIYSFSACCILLKSEPYQLFIIPCYPLNPTFLETMIKRIASAAQALDFLQINAQQLARTAYLDAPDNLARNYRETGHLAGPEIGSSLNIPLTVENRIIGMLSLFDEKKGTFDTDMLRWTTMIADYAAIALENVSLRERENALWREAELERQRLELIITSMAEGLLIIDSTGTIVKMNSAAQRLLSQAQLDSQDNVPLRTLARTGDVPWLPRLSKIVEAALKGKTVTNQELVVGTSGESVPLTLSIGASPLHDASEPHATPIGVVAVLNDVTSIKQIDRMKDEFVSVVSHELRTPLTAIKGYTQHLVRRIERRLRKISPSSTQVADPPENYDLRSLNIIQSQTEHLERLVSDLMDLSRVQWSTLNLHFETFYLADLLSDLVRSVQASAEQHTIRIEILPSDTSVTADRERIGQVVGNILDNAIKYSPQGGQITVRLSGQGEDYQVSVIDQGVGVSPEHYAHIFERFYRVHNTASHQYTGIGLGLFVARAIIEGHGGQIWFDSTPGRGSKFHFTLPHTPRPPES